MGKPQTPSAAKAAVSLAGRRCFFFVNKFTTYNVDLSRHFLAIHESNFRIWWNDTPETAFHLEAHLRTKWNDKWNEWNDTPETAFHLEAHLRTKWNDKWNEWNDAKNRRSTNYDIII